MKFGYARVSRPDQKIDLQVNALLDYGVKREHIYIDKKSGATMDREGLKDVFNMLREDDEIVVWKIGRLSRSVADFLEMREMFKKEGVKLTVLTVPLDLDSSTGKFFSTLLAAFAEFERDQLIERTNAGLAAARKRREGSGRKLNYALADSEIDSMLHEYQHDLTLSVPDLAAKYKVSAATLRNLRKKAGIPERKRGRAYHKNKGK